MIAGSLDRLAADVELDLVHICTPLETHEAEVLRAVSRGWPALVEKPVAPTAAATDRLVASAARAGSWIEPAHQLVFQDGVREALSWTRFAGPLRVFDYRVCSAGAEQHESSADRVAADILPHPLSLVQAICPAGLEAVRAWHVQRPAPGELGITGIAGSTALRLFISMHGRPPRHELMLVADTGTLMVDLFHGFAWRESGSTSRRYKLERPFLTSAAVVSHAAVNLARRTMRREPAYPGLMALVAQVYAALSNPTSRPLGDRHLLAVARARDRIIEQVVRA